MEKGERRSKGCRARNWGEGDGRGEELKKENKGELGAGGGGNHTSRTKLEGRSRWNISAIRSRNCTCADKYGFLNRPQQAPQGGLRCRAPSLEDKAPNCPQIRSALNIATPGAKM
jgi:hypothetical protein